MIHDMFADMLALLEGRDCSQPTQVLLRLLYQSLDFKRAPLPSFMDVEFRCFSQNGEDGILLYIFSMIGVTNRHAVELCAGDGIECNAANLVINHGWLALLVDGNPDNVTRGIAFYATHKSSWLFPPKIVCHWVRVDNVDSLVAEYGFRGEPDLLSLDLDGNDYWILASLSCIRPRVIVLEFNGSCGPHEALTMSYNPEYRLDVGRHPYRCGASLPAFVDLCRSRGYRLIGIQTLGFNAFFLRNDVGIDIFPERSAADCFHDSPVLRRWETSWLDNILCGDERWERIARK